MQTQYQDTPEQPAAERRVKKEEFAHAIAALEARRQAEAQQQEGTVVIGDVLEQLQINVPAEEVLQEIQALHAGEPREVTPKRSSWTAERIADTKLVSGIILVPLAVIVLGALLFHPVQPALSSSYPQPATRFVPWLMPDPNSQAVIFSSPITEQEQEIQEIDEGGFNGSSVLKPLSAIPNEQVIRCNTSSLIKILTPSPLFPVNPAQRALNLALSKQIFDVRPGLQKPWRLIKHEGKLYVRGWTSAQFTQKQAQQHPVALHASPDSFEAGITPVKVTLPVASQSYMFGSFGSGGGKGIQWASVALDNHAWEDWKP